jgi:hypothetical protein
MLFMGRRTAEDILESPLPGLDPGDSKSLAAMAGEILRVRNALASTLDWQSKEKSYLIVSSVLGTLTWGFGDLASAALVCHVASRCA